MYNSVCFIILSWVFAALVFPVPKQQLDSLYLSDTSPLVSQKLASPVQGSPVWDSCGSSPHYVSGQPALVCPTKRTHSDRSAVTLPALLDAHLRRRTAVNAEDAASLLYPHPPVSNCRLASLLLISDAVKLVSRLQQSFNQHAPLLCLSCTGSQRRHRPLNAPSLLLVLLRLPLGDERQREKRESGRRRYDQSSVKCHMFARAYIPTGVCPLSLRFPQEYDPSVFCRRHRDKGQSNEARPLRQQAGLRKPLTDMVIYKKPRAREPGFGILHSGHMVELQLLGLWVMLLIPKGSFAIDLHWEDQESKN
ncbi:hypothetical protein EYF80_009658 [Liparis tanakae]|uniref:Uncharacterized protein n=1 Tax=Liparis tanakae TaxID=230148 RepID=A0A4Z2IQK7_9TELE|nr:hypothetical protein EYF80_009658 [Liparis tanakae]